MKGILKAILKLSGIDSILIQRSQDSSLRNLSEHSLIIRVIQAPTSFSDKN